MPEISVIIPCYNQAPYLADALESLLIQDFSNWEAIIVNDASTDTSETIASEYVKKDSRFQLVNAEKNGGLSAARNLGVAHASSRYILPLDADDKIGSKYIGLALAAFAASPQAKVVYCKAAFFGDKTGNWPLPDYSYPVLLSRNPIFCSAVFRKSDLEKAGGFRPSFGFEDWDLWLRMLTPDDQVICLDYLGFFYRQLSNSMITTLKEDKANYRRKKNEMLLRHADTFFDWTEHSLYFFMEAYQNQSAREKRIDKNPVSRLVYAMAKWVSKW